MPDVLIAKQFSAVYDEREDRIRLIININYPTRYDFWITRKFLIDILDNLQNIIPNQNEQPANNQKNNSQETLKIYEAQNEPLLLETINIKKENNTLKLTLQDKNTTVEAVLTPAELKNLLKILVNPVQMRWGIFI